ncbi:MAG: hypothetical protein R6X02_02310 [Enhygromyxa sp.]
MRPIFRAALFISITSSALFGCDFFRELESLPEAGEDESDDDADEADEAADESGGETGAEPCTVLDDHCSDQDTLHSCNFETGELDTYHCTALCDGVLNFTCTPTADFRHACWCVSPGDVKVDTCAQLESCLINCGDPSSTCSHACFSRTDYQTIRLLGTLYSCADRACDDLCAASPADCDACLLAARAGLWGDCGLQRQVCDADLGDEPTWP